MATSTTTPTHAAVVTVSPIAPLEIHYFPTPTPTSNEVKVLVQWTASTPLDMHQALGHLFVNPPQVLGDGVAGTVVAVGPEVTKHRVGDKVFGFTWRKREEKAHQTWIVTDERLLGKIPGGFSMGEVVTVPNNFVTGWHTLTTDFDFALPWPKPETCTPPEERKKTIEGKEGWILIWGGGSSAAMYTIQVLKYYGFKNVAVVASRKHEEKLKGYGASVCFDYRDNDVVEQINAFQADGTGRKFSHILDCIGSLDGSVKPVSQLAQRGSKVAVLLPVIVRDAAKNVKPEYTMDVPGSASWAEGVEAVGVRTHLYMKNPQSADQLQSEIMPKLLAEKVIVPNEQLIVEGETMLDRAQKALFMLRDKQVSGERLVWRIAEDDFVNEVLRGLN